ncbi:MAG: tRNA epoxyqueuosine(34) reductase QueG [Bacteroidales bacterium]|jgi:epoxyqueuosine reductase|nr:tRNA epoxyqueuosine(34) reductase QueG [Bacteroidales bacterium]
MLNSDLIKSFAFDLGFDDCGITNCCVSEKYFNFFNDWLDKNYHADMNYLKKNLEIRKNLNLLVENAKSVIVVLMNYNNIDFFKDKNISIAKYAYGTDYHIVIKNKLYDFIHKIKEIYPNVNCRCFVDSAPILERYFAKKAGLGFIGKNNCLITKKFGSFVFIGEIILDLEFINYDKENIEECEKCNKCIEFCPTGALTEFCLNSNKCISYQTIENKNKIPKELSNKIKKQIFGCDICQNVCPHNQNLEINNHAEFQILPKILNFDKSELNNLTDKKFEEKFSETALSRINREKMVGNCGN